MVTAGKKRPDYDYFLGMPAVLITSLQIQVNMSN
jgi:hypothetical protein